VLAKLLLCCEEINDLDLYTWRQDTIDLSTMRCDIPSYLDLLQLCYNRKLNAATAAAFVRSICMYKFGFKEGTEISKRTIDVSSTLIELETNNNVNEILATLFGCDLNDRKLIEILIQYTTKEETSIQATALLATMLPEELNAWFSALQISHEQRAVMSDLNEIAQRIHESKYFEAILDSISQLTTVNKNDPAAIQLLITCLGDPRADAIRKQAAKVLRTFPPTKEVISALINRIEEETVLTVKAEIITTLGEICTLADEVVPVLQGLTIDTNTMIVRRAMVSLVKIVVNNQTFEDKKMFALRLCAELKQSDNAEEKKQVVIGLRYLKVNDPEVVQILFALLADQDKEVSFEAGKTIAALQELSK
jgi:hypothetical protein